MKESSLTVQEILQACQDVIHKSARKKNHLSQFFKSICLSARSVLLSTPLNLVFKILFSICAHSSVHFMSKSGLVRMLSLFGFNS